MNNPWVTERRRLIALVSVMLVSGLLSGLWALSILIPASIYIGWLLLQLYRLEQWLSQGFKPRKVPDSSGAWDSIIVQILGIRKKDKTLQKKLAKMAKGYRNTVKALPDAAIVVNQDLEIEWVNQTAERYLGINSKQDIGYRITNLIRIPEFNQYLASPGHKPLEIELPDGPNMTLSLRVIRYGRDQRLILGRDISERIQSRNALRAFVSNASHELRTPLTVTSGYIQLLEADPSLPEHLRAPVEQLREQSEHMTSLINDLLTLSQLEGDMLADYEGRSVNLAALISQFIQDLQISGMDSGHSIACQLDASLAIRGVERELISIYTNLIENALKYTPPGTQVSISWQKGSDGQPCLTVSDDGPGFSRQHLPQLTQRFYRIDSPESAHMEGTGLGLAIVKHAVIHHGGSLAIDSEPGKGAEFRVCFPAQRAVAAK